MMPFDATTYSLLMDVAGACAIALRSSAAPIAEPPSALLSLRAGLAESPAWFLIQALEFDPQPLTVENIRVRDVYASERIVQALLELMAGEQWLVRTTPDEYVLTATGRALVDHLRRRRLRLGELDLFVEDELIPLADTLNRLIEASAASNAPPATWCLAHSRRRSPAPDTAALVRIAASFDDFNAFRDDAHMAAWQALGIDGYVWEAFALVCDGTATGAAVYERLVHRGYALYEYAAALDQLADRGWLTSSDTLRFTLTDQGREVRAAVEHQTDHFFYRSWVSVTDVEREALEGQLHALRDRLLARYAG